MMRHNRVMQFLMAALLLLPVAARAQGLGGPNLEAKPYVSVSAAPRGSQFMLAVVIDVKKPYHINANVVKDDLLIPTQLQVTAPKGLSAGKVVYPPFHVGTFFGEKLNVFEGKTTFKVPIKVAANAPLGVSKIKAKLQYQACDEKNCYAPQDASLEVPVKIVAAGQPAKPINGQIFGGTAAPPAGGATRAEAAAPAAAATARTSGSGQLDIAQNISKYGWLPTLGIIFLLGLALNLTPCVYPLIPVTIGYFGGQAQGAENRRSRTFLLAIFYVLGMALTYSTLGVVAALAGKTFGFVFQSPLVPAVVAGIIVALALSMFGLYEIRPPSFITNNARARGGPFGAMFMGLIVGFVAAPCIGPVVSALVTFVATTRNPAIGFGLFFTLAMGLGLPYLFLGAFTGAASALPKSGAWTEMVKRVFGVLMLGTALYFVRSFMPDGVFAVLFPAYILAAGVYLIFGEHELAQNRRIVAFKSITGLTAAAVAVWMLVGVGMSAGHRELVQWTPYSAATLTSAKEAGKPVMMDFYADWCVACKELDEKTFSDPRVAVALKEFVIVKVDNTTGKDPEVQALMKQYKINGLPTVLFLGPDGRELPQLRLEEFEAPDKFLTRVQGATNADGDSVARLP